jgi:hypothetical protein
MDAGKKGQQEKKTQKRSKFPTRAKQKKLVQDCTMT